MHCLQHRLQRAGSVHRPQPSASSACRPPLMQRRQRRCAAAAEADAAAATDATSASEPQQQQSMTIPMPLGSTEPEAPQPAKLSPAARLSEALLSTTLTIVGDDTELNAAVCQALSKKIGWFPVLTSKVLLGLHKAASLQEIVDKEGSEALAKAEAGVLRGLRDQKRCCIATIGGGAAADAGVYANLYGTIIIWLDEQDKRAPKRDRPARRLFAANAEVRAALTGGSGGGFGGGKPLSTEEKAQRAAGQLVSALGKLLKQQEDLLALKAAYVARGCRGDWPELQPAGWNPLLDRRPLADGDAESDAEQPPQQQQQQPPQPGGGGES